VRTWGAACCALHRKGNGELIGGGGVGGRVLGEALVGGAGFLGVLATTGARVGGTQGEIDFGVVGEGFLGEFELWDGFLVVVDIEIKQAEKIVSEGDVGIEFDGLFSIGDAGG